MNRWVDVTFDCLPLRSVVRLDIPLDASPVYQEHCRRVKEAMEKHGSHNSYYLYNASCTYHLTNDDTRGQLRFGFDGTVLTGADDQTCRDADLDIKLAGETCEWLTQSVVDWFLQTVPITVATEFDRYIAVGDLQQTKERLATLDKIDESSQGFLGMHL